jgi:dienelactone hydrolase
VPAASSNQDGPAPGRLAVGPASPAQAALTPDGTYGVRVLRFTLVEPAGAGLPERVLPTQVWAPVVPRRTAVAGTAHRPPYPLVVFSQGYDLAVGAYAGLLASWASAGFVVVAPAYPGTNPSPGAALDEADIINHPRDLRFVIATVVAMSHQRRSALQGLVDPSEVGIAGHSDGGDVTVAVGDNSCCRDGLVKAVAVLSGAELVSFGGTYFGAPSPPLLVVQGNEDNINFPACSTQIYDSARGTKFYLDLLDAGHEPPYAGPETGPRQDRGIVTRVTTDFFDAELAHEPGALAAMRAAASAPGVASLRVGGLAPPEPGGCPGAPGG